MLFSDDDTYLSRDSRFLGTIGFYYDLCLPLKKGRFEIWIAVTERFAGWGVMGKFRDMNAMEVINGPRPH